MVMQLTDVDREKVSAAIAAAEAQTSGEIVAVTTPISDAYHDVALHWALGETLLLCHGAKHLRLRRFANEPFQPLGCRRIARVTEEVTAEVLASFAGRGEIELFSEYSAPVRIKVMSRLIGPSLRGGAAAQQLTVHGLLVFEGEARCRGSEER